MRKNQINAILVEQAKRRNTIFSFSCIIIIIFILSLSLFLMYLKNSEDNYATYDEKSDIDYKVYLKENEFFENNFLGSNKQYIASLIDKITAQFKYELKFDTEDVEYKYEYRIDANVKVFDEETNNILFSKTENLLPEEVYITDEKESSINKTVTIDYNYFNDLISKFVSVYHLDDVESVLTIDMYITTIGSCEEFYESEENESVITLSIPLTTKTIAIEMSNDLVDTENNVILCDTNELNYVLLIFSILTLLLDIVIIVFLVRYEIETRTAETIYTKKLKKILNNYGSYIQEMGDDFDLEGYQLIIITTFEDILEIRDTIKQPILMKQNKEKTGAYFIVPSNSKFIYIYRIKLEDMEVKKNN